jgi:hypothetical protein
MTRASAARRLRRQRGRPQKDITTAEQQKIRLVTALQAAWGISERKAFDLLVALSEAELETANNGRAGFRLPYTTFAGRTSTLRKKRKSGAAPNDETTALMTLALRCQSLQAALKLFRGLLALGETEGAKAVSKVVRQLLSS